MTALYPSSFEDIPGWAAENRLSIREARQRFAQYAILRAVAATHSLRHALVLKGGNALDFVWQPNRSTKDLDFSVDMSASGTAWDAVALRGIFAGGFVAAGQQVGVTLVVHGVEQRPRGAEKTFITFQVRIGYALPDEHKLRLRIRRGEPSSQVIRLDISLNEEICADDLVAIDGEHKLRVSTIEDVVAEKLRAFLQQEGRERFRPQDLLDIAVILQKKPNLNRRQVAEFLLRKSAARNVSAGRSAFRRPELRTRAHEGYVELKSTVREAFVPFDEALKALYNFVDSLDLPSG